MKPEGKMKQLDTTTTAATPASADNNVMPSMVVRQQRIQMGSSVLHHPSINQVTGGRRPPHQGSGYQPNDIEQQPTQLMAPTSPQPPPPPPPHPFSLIRAAKEMNNIKNSSQQQQQFDQDGLVLPKRVLHHPVSVAQPIIRDLNRELKFNQIRGKNVLDQKSELKKALEKLQDNKRRREAEQERLNRRTSLELRLEERAERIAKSQQTNFGSQPTTRKLSADQSDSSVTESTTTNCTKPPLSNFTIRPLTR